MNRALLAGIGLITIGVAGYALGVGIAYPGRSLSITAVMVGISMIFVRRAWDDEEDR